MQLDVMRAIGLLLLVILIPAYQGLRNWQKHRVRQQVALDHRWRYSYPGWKAIIRPSFTIAGTTPGGTVWELKRVQQNKQWFLVWSALNRLLPYGRLAIVPRAAGSLERLRQNNLRLIITGDRLWQEEYALFSTHHILAERHLNKQVTVALQNWPGWPAPGSLEDVDWRPGRLQIRCRYYGDWQLLERIVFLGTALVETKGE